MVEKHPYISGTAVLTAVLHQLRTSFPTRVDAETLKKRGITLYNGRYIERILRFIGVIDANGSRTAQAAVFSSRDNSEFHAAFADVVKSAYNDLFSVYGDDAWTLDLDALAAFFRGSDETSDLVGERQASTFKVLATFAGHCDFSARRRPASPKPAGKMLPKPTARAKEANGSGGRAANRRDGHPPSGPSKRLTR